MPHDAACRARPEGSEAGLRIAYGRPDRAWDPFVSAAPSAVATSGAELPDDVAALTAGDTENALVVVYPSGTIALLVASAPRTWAAPVAIAELGELQNHERIYTGDTNGDGHTDIVVTFGETFAVLHGTPTPRFEAPVFHGVLGHGVSIAVAASFHGDGRLDLVVKDYGLGLSLLPHACE